MAFLFKFTPQYFVNPPPPDRKLQLEISKDGAHNWPIHREIPLGELGEYEHRILSRRFGQGRRFTAKVRVTSPVRVDVFGLVAEYDVEQ